LIAREYRLKAKKEKKKGKSDAKKQRKENAILLRREVKIYYCVTSRALPTNNTNQTRNNEKYSKNKDRNMERAIDMERNKIREAAVRQAEKLAGQYDLSGKLFNVGEVIIMPDGQAKSVERLQKTADVKEQRAVDRKEKQERNLVAEAKKASKPSSTLAQSSLPSLDGVNPQRAGLIKTTREVATPNHSRRLSNKQQMTNEKSIPRSTLLKPVIPQGYDLPEDEENFIAMWDLTDGEIKKRLGLAKQKSENERKALRRKQKAEKEFNKAMKVLKKEAAIKGVLFDTEKAKKIILGEEVEKHMLKGKMADSGSDTDSSSNSDSTSSSGSGLECEGEGEGGEPKTPRKSVKLSGPIPLSDADNPKKRKRFVADTEAELGASKSPSQPVQNRKRDSSKQTLEPEFTDEQAQLKLRKEQKRKDKLAAKMGESQEVTENPAKKRKRDIEAKRDTEPLQGIQTTPMKKQKNKTRAEKLESTEALEVVGSEKMKHKKSAAIEPVSAGIVEVIPTEKKHKKKKSEISDSASNDRSITGENWNTDALAGDEARKQKFLRLLGAGKAKGGEPKQTTSNKIITDISRVQNDLEKQYEAGMKLKHNGGSKRRGLGA